MKPLCTIIYPITVTLDAVLKYNCITEEEFKGMTEDAQREAILSLGDYFLQDGGVTPLITECEDFEHLND